jgi:hypothetical protein
MGRSLLRALVVVLLVLSPVALLRTAASAASLNIEMKLLVISADGAETDYPAITSFLDQVGVPYDTLIARNTPLTAAMLSDSASHGKYEGIVLTTGNLVYYDAATNSWPSALTQAQWNILHAYQAQFKVRSVTSFTYPEAAYGMSPVGYQDTLVTPLNATYTAAGAAVFSNANTTKQLPINGAWVYFGTVVNPAVTTPLLNVTVGGKTYPVASVTTYPTGYQNLAITAANNPQLVHSLVLSRGWINWVTKGTYVGSYHATMDVQVDDLFIDDDLWNPTTHTAGAQTYRNSPTDLNALTNWQNARKLKPSTPAMKTEFAFVGVGSTAGEYVPDNLTPAVQLHKNDFGFINHTFDHFNLDCGDCPDPTGVITTTAAQIQSEITQNIAQGQALGLPFDTDVMVQPDISGINTPPNPMAQKAAADAGIRYWIGDTSRAGQNNPTFNTGFYAPGDSRLYVVPRHPTNIFYDVSNQAQVVDLFNYFYAPGGVLCPITTCYTTKQTYTQILDHESDYLLRYLLQGDLDPLMFHTPNVRAYDGTHSVLSDLLDRTFSRYEALVKVPIQNKSFRQVGQAEQARGAFNASGVKATVTSCTAMTLTVANAATIPVSGISYTAANSTVETYNGQPISSITLTAGQSVSIPLPAAVC